MLLQESVYFCARTVPLSFVMFYRLIMGSFVMYYFLSGAETGTLGSSLEVRGRVGDCAHRQMLDSRRPMGLSISPAGKIKARGGRIWDQQSAASICRGLSSSSKSVFEFLRMGCIRNCMRPTHHRTHLDTAANDPAASQVLPSPAIRTANSPSLVFRVLA